MTPGGRHDEPADGDTWPSLPLAAWQDTYATLHLWTQVIGKVRLALAPPINHWWHDFGEFVLPYRVVQTAPSPDEALLAFLQSTYEAAAECGHWDRQSLERRPPPP